MLLFSESQTTPRQARGSNLLPSLINRLALPAYKLQLNDVEPPRSMSAMRRFFSRDESPPFLLKATPSPWRGASLLSPVLPPTVRLKPANPVSRLRVELKAFSSRTLALPDILSTSLFALKESADAFPPLKSAVGGVLAVWDIAQRAKHSKSDACEIALRTEKILNVIADAVPDGSAIPPPLLLSIERFTVLLDSIRCSMEDIAFSGRLNRLFHLRRNECELQTIKTQLDDAYRDLLAASVLRGEVQQTQLVYQQAQFGLQQTQVQLDLENVAAVTNQLLRYAKITLVSCFFGRPLMLLYKFIKKPIRPDTRTLPQRDDCGYPPPPLPCFRSHMSVWIVSPDLASLSRDRLRPFGRARQTLPRRLSRSRLRLATWRQKPSKCSASSSSHHARGTASQGTNPVFFFLSSTVLKRGHWPPDDFTANFL
ncbi:hypothetical protein B0H13DRAFT_2057247 [Mycena leptocephala]|nr:hypothetical protein B0H13DRAFT_2057247 [Mycena leptocephala]